MSNQLLGRGNTVAAIDEMYLFLTNMTAIEYIRNGMKRVRKKESSFILASQNGQLAESKGKKVYGYLKSDVKKTVDEIFIRLADNESVKKMYDLWCEMEQQKHDVYSSARVDFPSLVDNKEFRSVKNMIIQTVMKMDFSTAEIETPEPDMDIPLPIDEEVIDETLTDGVENFSQNKLYIKWSDSYKEAHKLILDKESMPDDYKKAEKLLLSESNNVLALYDLGKLYSMEESGLKSDKKSFELYEKALQGFIQIEPRAKKIKPYSQYQIGMMYFKGLGTPIDNQKASEYLEKSAELGNQYAKRLLAFEYISGKNFEQNILDFSVILIPYRHTSLKPTVLTFVNITASFSHIILLFRLKYDGLKA